MIVFTVEAIIMFAFNFDALMLKQWQIMLIDGLILSSLSVSLIYLFVIKYAFSLNQSHNTQKNTTKLTSSLAYFCSAVLLYIALYMFYQSQLQTRINNVIQHEKNELKQAKKAFLQQLNHASRDLLILRNNHHFKDHDILSSVNRAQLEQDYANAPSPQSTPTQYQSDLLSAAFSSNLEEFIKKYTDRIDIWAHGHTHHNVNYQIADTRIISNQRGYSSLENYNFDCGYVVEI